MRAASSRRLATAIFVATAVVFGAGLRLYWSWLLPYNDAPDEAWHFPMVAFICQEGRLPTLADVPARIPNSYPALPPLGYFPSVLAVWAGSWLGIDAVPYHSARLGNVVIGALTIWVGFLAARGLAPVRHRIAVAVAWILALHPQLILLNASINPDSTAFLGATFLWYLWVRLARTGQSPGLALAVGLAAGASLMAKANALAAVLAGLPLLCRPEGKGARSRLPQPLAARRASGPAGPEGCFAQTTPDPFSRLRTGRWVALPAASALVVCAPWMIWSWRHHGTLVGIDAHRVWWKEFLANQGEGPGPLVLAGLGEFASRTWTSLWAALGYCTVWLEPHHYLAITAACGLAAGALATRWAELAGWCGWAEHRRFGSLVAAMALGPLLCVIQLVGFSTAFWSSPQGRYLLPAIWVIVAGFVVGLAMLARRVPCERMLLAAAVALFGWIETAAIQTEVRSNRIRQRDRCVRTQLLAWETSLPAAGPDQPLPWTLLEEATAQQPSFVCSLAAQGAQCGWAVLELDHQRSPRRTPSRDESPWTGEQGETPETLAGVLEVRRPDGSERVVDAFGFRQRGYGVYQHQFDLGKRRAAWGDAPVEFAVRIESAEGLFRVRHFEIHPPGLRPAVRVR